MSGASRQPTRSELVTELRECEQTYWNIMAIMAKPGGATDERKAAARRWREAGEKAAAALGPGWEFHTERPARPKRRPLPPATERARAEGLREGMQDRDDDESVV